MLVICIIHYYLSGVHVVKSADLTLKMLEYEWESIKKCKEIALIGLDKEHSRLVESQYDRKLFDVLKKIVNIEDSMMIYN